MQIRQTIVLVMIAILFYITLYLASPLPDIISDKDEDVKAGSNTSFGKQYPSVGLTVDCFFGEDFSKYDLGSRLSRQNQKNIIILKKLNWN